MKKYGCVFPLQTHQPNVSHCTLEHGANALFSKLWIGGLSDIGQITLTPRLSNTDVQEITEDAYTSDCPIPCETMSVYFQGR